ncbi:MAG TPA: hypothetical protein VJQ56_04990 [Blastocatellia bacterium]|nr:hypothetical protein [Blastocatellia bacterium]
MGIEIQMTQKGVKPGQVATFTFKNQVQAYALGIWAFRLSYGENVDHWVQDFSIKMLPTQTEDSSVAGNVVSVRVNARLQDSSGNTVNLDAATVIYPVCVAMTGTYDSNTVMTNVGPITNGTSASVGLPGSSGFSAVVSFLSGFALDFSTADHQVLGASAGCGITYNQSTGLISSSATLYDADGNNANIATVDVGVLASTDANPGFAIKEVTSQTETGVNVIFPSGTPIREVCCLIRSWQVEYDSVHNVREFSIGTWGYPTISGNTVTLPNLYAHIADSSGNQQNDLVSNATVLVIAIP